MKDAKAKDAAITDLAEDEGEPPLFWLQNCWGTNGDVWTSLGLRKCLAHVCLFFPSPVKFLLGEIFLDTPYFFRKIIVVLIPSSLLFLFSPSMLVAPILAGPHSFFLHALNAVNIDIHPSHH